ncbi:hypothetical protein [Acidovorax sp. PRC11]|uniref:hypothetical protein n=1 Tax=Acidovorax sp. PRC11 TaxID=2962592 RepID=UPI0028825004|nr:hypothetical protein [Acidovorax sp. PRC11]MDT0137734.1 hypothetical protein [Acidovorax sp. PRC11]
MLEDRPAKGLQAGPFRLRGALNVAGISTRETTARITNWPATHAISSREVQRVCSRFPVSGHVLMDSEVRVDVWNGSVSARMALRCLHSNRKCGRARARVWWKDGKAIRVFGRIAFAGNQTPGLRAFVPGMVKRTDSCSARESGDVLEVMAAMVALADMPVHVQIRESRI